MKNRFVHQLLSISLSTVMVFSSLGIPVFAAETAAADDVLSSDSDCQDPEDAVSVSYDKDSNILSLNSFDSENKITVSANGTLTFEDSNDDSVNLISTESSMLSAGIYSDGDITIELNDDSTVSFDTDCGIAANGDIEFIGTGTLAIKGSADGIMALDGNVIVNGPDIRVIDGKVSADSLTVNDGSVSAENVRSGKLETESSEDVNEELSEVTAEESDNESSMYSEEDATEEASFVLTEDLEETPESPSENGEEASSFISSEDIEESSLISTEDATEEASFVLTEDPEEEASTLSTEDSDELSSVLSTEDAEEASSLLFTVDTEEDLSIASTEDAAMESSEISTEDAAEDELISTEALEIQDISASLDKSSLTLYSGGDEGRLTCSFPIADHTTSWSSEDESVAIVTGHGDNCIIDPISISEDYAQTKITATVAYTYSDGSTKECTAECLVTVKRNEIPEGIAISRGIYYSIPEKSFEYTGSKITPEVEVFNNNRVLTKGTDYTVSYKNNINAAAADSKNAPSLTITLKGRYSGKVTERFTILPVDISEDTFESPDNLTVQYNKKQQMPAPTLRFNGKALKYGTDFYVAQFQEALDRKDKTSYIGNPHNNLIETLTIVGKKNFKGTRTFVYTIAGLDSSESIPQVLMSKVTVSAIANVPYSGESYEFSDLKDKKGAPIVVSYKGKTLTEGTDFTAEALGSTEIGTASVILTGISDSSETGYCFIGSKTVTFKITGTSISGAQIAEDGDKYHPYTGDEVIPSFIVSYKGEALNEGDDYCFNTIENADYIHPGTKTVIFQGLGKYYGTKKVTYKISGAKIDFSNEELFSITTLDGQSDITAEFSKGGAKPEVLVKYNGNGAPVSLKEGTDYTIKYTGNTAISTLSKKPAAITITGKGNYTGSSSKTFTIVSKDIGKVNIYAADVAMNAKPGKYKAKLTLTDTDGKTLKAGTDYDTNFKYSSEDMNDLDISKACGNIPVIYVTVTGKNNYKGNISGSYHVYNTAQSTSVSKLIAYADAESYTGYAVEPQLVSSEEVTGIHLYKSVADKKNHICIEDPEKYVKIISYSSNVNVGTAKVTLQGIGDYYGTKTVTFKINKTALDAKVLLDKTRLDMMVGSETDITASVLPECLNDTSLNWKTSNGNIVLGANTTDTGETNTVKAVHPGSTVITVTSPAIGKSFNCTVTVSKGTISMSPAALTMYKGDTSNITVTSEPSGIDPESLTWKSSDPTVASIGKDGTVTALKIGTTTISIVSKDYDVLNKCEITVSPVPVDINPSSLSLKRCETCTLTAVNVLTGTEVSEGLSWVSSDPSIVSVSSTGVVTGISAGKATINVISDSFMPENICTVTVRNEFADGVAVLDHADGQTDTDAFNSVLSEKFSTVSADTPKVAYVKAGTYTIDANRSVKLSDYPNLTFIMDKDAVLQAEYTFYTVVPGGKSNYGRVLTIQGGHDITVTGGQIIGEKATHINKNNNNDQVYGIDICESSNITISGVTIKDFWYDGIDVRATGATPNFCENVTIDSCVLSGNRRNNIALTGAAGVTINNCTITNAGDKSIANSQNIPECGIDIETNCNSRGCSDINITNCTISQKYGYYHGAISSPKKASNVTIDNCTVSGNIINYACKNMKVTNSIINGRTVSHYLFGSGVWEFLS